MPPKSTPSIGRPARGLARYFMDCGWYRHPRFAGLAPDALFVFEAAVGYCTEHATDGLLPAHHEDLAAALGLRASAVKKAIGPLIERGAIVKDGDRIAIRNWADHNPTAAEVDEFNRSKSKSGALGNHKRWHESRGVTDPECEFCDPTSDRKPVAPAIANGSHQGSHGMGWDGMGTSSSPPPSPIAEATEKVNPEEDQPPNPDTPEARTQAAIEHMARCDLRAQGTTVKHPDNWLTKAVATRTAQLGRQILEDAYEHPDASPVDLAERADPACGPDDGGLARALASAAKVDQAAADAAQFRADRARAQEILHTIDGPDLEHLEQLADTHLASIGLQPGDPTHRITRKATLEALALEHHGTTTA